jgi:hypothetical protein
MPENITHRRKAVCTHVYVHSHTHKCTKYIIILTHAGRPQIQKLQSGSKGRDNKDKVPFHVTQTRLKSDQRMSLRW